MVLFFNTRWYGIVANVQIIFFVLGGIIKVIFLKVIIQLPNQVATCRALYDFRMVNDEDEGCLSFRKDEIITVIRRVDENWAEGVLNNQIGIFPLAFVEMNKIAQVLMKLSIK